MKKVKNRNSPVMVFALTTDTTSIKKFPVDDNGKVINPRFNAKTFTKKAYKSYLKGKTYFTYKVFNKKFPFDIIVSKFRCK